LNKQTKSLGMKYFYLLNFLVFSFCSGKSQQIYNVGYSTNQILFTGSYSDNGIGCGFIAQPLIGVTLDSLLIPYVTGLRIQFEVLNILPSGTVYCQQLGINLNPGDSIVLPGSTNRYDFLFSFFGQTINYQIVVRGVPTLLFEQYYCTISQLFTLADCNNTHLLFPDTISTPVFCQVLPPEGIENTNEQALFTISPNPSYGNFFIQMADNVSYKTEIEIYNVMGEKIYESEINTNNADIDLASHPAGIYFIRIKTESKVVTQKLIIQ